MARSSSFVLATLEVLVVFEASDLVPSAKFWAVAIKVCLGVQRFMCTSMPTVVVSKMSFHVHLYADCCSIKNVCGLWKLLHLGWIRLQVECPCVATGVDFLNAEKEYTRTNYKANQTSNWIPTV